MLTDGPNLPVFGRSPFERMQRFFKRVCQSLLMAVIACFCLGYAVSVVSKERRYSEEGVSTTAQVVEKERHLAGGRYVSWAYTVRYRYRDSAGEAFEGQREVPQSVWEQSEKGQDLTVEYLRDEPSESRLPAYSPFRHWFDVVGGTACCGGWGLWLLYAAIMEPCKPVRK